MSSKVFKAFDIDTKTWVAIKHINPHIANDPVGVERFRREIQITRKLHHPQVIKVFDLNESTDGIFLVMEYLDGTDLNTYLKTGETISLDQSLDFFKQLLGTLESCHANNVIHRDIKPQNIFVLKDGSLKLLDFGISRMSTLSDLTQTGTSLGSPEYMAPELFSENVFDPRTDLYALGVVVYQIIAGQLPFDGETLAVLFRQHVENEVKSLSDLRPDVPPWLDQCIKKLLAKNPVDRYQSASEVLVDLKNERVTTQILPKSKRRTCLSCGKQTVPNIPICLRCGYEPKPYANDDSYLALWLPANLPVDRFQGWLNQLDQSQKLKLNFKKRTKLIGSLNEEMAQLIKSNASQSGILLEIVSEKPKEYFRQNLPLILIGAFVFVSLYYSLSISVGADIAENSSAFFRLWKREPSWYRKVFIFGISSLGHLPANLLKTALSGDISMPALSLLQVIFGSYWFFYFFPTLKGPLFGKLSDLSFQSVNKFAWFKEVASFLRSKKSDALRDMEFAILESFLSVRLQPGLPMELGQQLDTSVINAIKTISYMGEVEVELNLSRERSKINDRYRQTAETLELEELYSRLTNHLVSARAQLNNIVGKVVADKNFDIEGEMARLSEGLKKIATEYQSFMETA